MQPNRVCGLTLITKQLKEWNINFQATYGMFFFFAFFSTIIKIKDIFTGILARHLCMSRFLSSFAFGNTDPYLSRVLISFAYGNTNPYLRWVLSLFTYGNTKGVI